MNLLGPCSKTGNRSEPALADKLKTTGAPCSEPVWMKLAGAFGKTASVRAETRRIQGRIDAEFETLEPEDAL